MRQLNEYLSAKVNVPKLKFPEKVDFENVVEFLEMAGLKKENDPNYPNYTDYATYVKFNHPYYIYDNHDNDNAYHGLYFSKGGKVSKHSPMFIINKYVVRILYDNVYKNMVQIEKKTEDKMSMFFKEINRVFGWECEN